MNTELLSNYTSALSIRDRLAEKLRFRPNDPDLCMDFEQARDQAETWRQALTEEPNLSAFLEAERDIANTLSTISKTLTTLLGQMQHLAELMQSITPTQRPTDEKEVRTANTDGDPSRKDGR